MASSTSSVRPRHRVKVASMAWGRGRIAPTQFEVGGGGNISTSQRLIRGQPVLKAQPGAGE